jgi:hypothetical protein
MGSSDRVHLHLVPAHKHEAETPLPFTQGVLFPLPESDVLLFTDVAKATAHEFVRLIEESQPKWIVDVRVAPRFDFGRLTRKAAFALFEKKRSRYLDLGWKLKIDDRQDARWNPVFLAEVLSESFAEQGRAFGGPVLFLFDEKARLILAEKLLPGVLRPSPSRGWTRYIVPCAASKQASPT